MNILFLVIGMLMMSSSFSQAAIEVYSAGKHFKSFEEYKSRFDQKDPSALTQALNAAEQAKSEPVVMDPGQEKMAKLSYNNGVSHVVVNFEQNWKNPKPKYTVAAGELEQVIAQALANQHEPTLLISDPTKLRIMAYDAQKNISLDRNSKKLDKTVSK